MAGRAPFGIVDDARVDHAPKLSTSFSSPWIFPLPTVKVVSLRTPPIHPGSNRMSEEEFGQRLRRARMVAGLSRAQVATVLAVRRADVARIEHGRRRVSTLELGKLARLYHKPSARCLVEPAGAPPIRYFRSDYRVDERDLIVIEEVGDWLAYYAWLERSALGAQRYEFPTYPLPAGQPTEQGECLAAEERSRLGLGEGDAIPSVVSLLEREGVKVAIQAFHPRSRASGCFLFSEGLGPCVILNRDRPPAGRRFAAAHASAEITVERVTRLSYDFGASFRKVVARLADIGWIDDRRRARLERHERLGHTAGPSHPDGQPGDTESEPARFRSVAVEAWRCGRISTGRLADLLDLPEADVALLLDQPLLEHERPHRAPSTEPDRL